MADVSWNGFSGYCRPRQGEHHPSGTVSGHAFIVTVDARAASVSRADVVVVQLTRRYSSTTNGVA